MSKKSHSPFEAGALNEAAADLLKTQQTRIEALGRAQAEFAKQFETMQRELMDSWQAQADAARTMCSDCAQNPSEAPKRYFDWLTAQVEQYMEQNRRLSSYWLNMMQSGLREIQQGDGGRGKTAESGHKVEHFRQTGSS